MSRPILCAEHTDTQILLRSVRAECAKPDVKIII